jgi:hypothetical protein
MRYSMSQTNACRDVSKDKLKEIQGGSSCSLLECGWQEWVPDPNDPPHCCDGTIVAPCGCTTQIFD